MLLRLTGLILLLATSLVACTGSSSKVSPQQEARSHYLLGTSALAENNPTQALQEFLLAEKADDRDAGIQDGLARAYMQKHAYDLAEKHFLEAIDLSDGNPEYYQNLGALYLSMERYDDAIAAFRKAADNLLFATPERAWTGVGFAQFQKQDYPAAERSYRKALELNARYAQGYFRLGELYYGQKRTVEAVVAFTRAVELEPRSANSQYWLGLAALANNDNDLARQSFAATIKLAPDSEQARLARNYLKVLK